MGAGGRAARAEGQGGTVHCSGALPRAHAVRHAARAQLPSPPRPHVPLPPKTQLLELLNMKGKHKHKWDYLRSILMERVVYDDGLHRAFYTDDTMSQGLLYSCKQARACVLRACLRARCACKQARVRVCCVRVTAGLPPHSPRMPLLVALAGPDQLQQATR